MSVQNGSTPPAVRTPDPLASSRRRALRRLEQGLRAMGLGAIGDIGSVSLAGTGPSITWESATDWNNAVDEQGVVHEIYGDYTDDSVVRLGHPTVDTVTGGSGLQSMWPLYEDSGTTAEDVVGTVDCEIVGPSLGQTGPLGSTSYSFDETDDHLDSNDASTFDYGTGNMSAMAWVKTSTVNSLGTIIGTKHFNFASGSGNEGFTFVLDDTGTGNGSLNLSFVDGNQYDVAFNYSDNTWHQVGFSLNNGAEVALYADGTQLKTYSVSSKNLNSPDPLVIGERAELDNSNNFGGNMAFPQIWNAYLTATEWADQYPLSDSHLTTGIKSFGSPQTPDLSALDYTLNGQTITLDVIGSPAGTSETVSQTLDGSTSYPLSWSNSHTDFQVQINMSSSDPTSIPEVNSLTLEGAA